MEGSSLHCQCSGLSRKATKSVGKNEGKAKGVGAFESGASVEIYFRVHKELAEVIFESLVLYFFKSLRKEREKV